MKQVSPERKVIRRASRNGTVWPELTVHITALGRDPDGVARQRRNLFEGHLEDHIRSAYQRFVREPIDPWGFTRTGVAFDVHNASGGKCDDNHNAECDLRKKRCAVVFACHRTSGCGDVDGRCASLFVWSREDEVARNENTKLVTWPDCDCRLGGAD